MGRVGQRKRGTDAGVGGGRREGQGDGRGGRQEEGGGGLRWEEGDRETDRDDRHREEMDRKGADTAHRTEST